MIYTSYFDNKNIPDAFVKVSVTRFPPKGWKGTSLPQLAPSKSLLKIYEEGMSWTQFMRHYKTELKKISPDVIIKDIEAIAPGRDIVLLCHEKDSEECHRSILTTWLNVFTNEGIRELPEEQ